MAQSTNLLQAQPNGVLQRRPPWTASARRTLAVATLNVVLVWAVAVAIIWLSYRDAVADWKRMAENFSQPAAAYTQQMLAASDLILKSMQNWLSDEDILTERQFAEFARGRRFHQAVRDRVVALPQVGFAAVFDTNGNLLSSSLAWPPPPTNIGNREAFRAQIDPKAPPLSISQAILGLNTNRWAFHVSRKIKSKADQVLGMTVVGIDSDYFANLFRSIALGEDSSVSLFRLDGALLATTRQTPELMGKFHDDADPVRMIREGLSGTAQLIRAPQWSDPFDAKARIVAARQVEGFPVLVAVTVGESIFLKPWRQRVYLVLALAVVASVLAVVLTLHLLRLGARNEAAARIASERRLLAALIDTLATFCAVLDRKGQVVYCNERFREVVAAGGNPADILSDPAVRGAGPILAFAANPPADPVEAGLEVAACHLHFSVSRQTLPEIGDCTILVGHDETLHHQAQTAMTQTAKLVTLGEMTTGMAHELSQPLNVIRMAAQNALSEVQRTGHLDAENQGVSDAEFRPFVAGKLTRIMGQVDRAASIIARMRVFGQAPEGPPAPYDARDACREALALVRQRLRTGGVIVQENLGNEPLRVHGHQNLLEQVLVNLLLNARDALRQSPRSDKAIKLNAWRGAAGSIGITVSDNGPGVPAEIRERIFEPFFTSKPVGQGTGLGLSLSFGIVREAGGTLSLLPSEHGTVFQIELPEESEAG